MEDLCDQRPGLWIVMSARLPSNRYSSMTKAELIRDIEVLKEAQIRDPMNADRPDLEELQKSLQDLEIHQAELELQNRELQTTQRLLEVSRDSYAQLFDYAPFGYVTLTASGIIRDLNFTASDLLRVERRKAMGFPFCNFVARDQSSEFWDHLRRCRRGDSRILTELPLQPRGEPPVVSSGVPVQLISVPAQGGDADETTFWTAIIDLTDRRRLESERESLIREQARRAEAEGANRAKDEFLATLSHELRTPLNVISGWIQLMQMENLGSEERLRGLDVMQMSVKQQVQIINDLLDMSRIIRGILHLERGAVDLRAVLLASVSAARLAAQDKSISLDMKLPAHPAMIIGDPARLNQIFSNLIQNALKFTAPNGKVTVSLELQRTTHDYGSTEEFARVGIRDTGAGIRPEFLPFVFERFRQEDSSTTRRHGGLGLGLAIVKHLAEAHGASVSADSEGEGKGATFTVTFPLIETPSPELPASLDSQERLRLRSLEGLAVLLVDDDASTRDVLVRTLAPLGAEMRAAGSAEEAFEMLRERLPSIIVCDIGMPEEDGLSLIGRIRDLPPEEGGRLPAVALTAYVGTVERDRALGAGFDTFLTKPIDPGDLAAEISRVVAGRSRS